MTSIQILGVSGSDATMQLRANVVQALAEMGVYAEVEQVTDVDMFIQYNINGIPALVLDGTVVLQKQVPNVEDLKILFGIFTASSSKRFDMKKILVPTDFSDTSKDAFHFALQLAKIQQGEVNAVHVYHPDFDPQNPYLTETVDLQKEMSEQRLNQFAKEESKGSSVGVSTESLIGFPVEEIIAQSRDASLVVMGTTGEKGFLEKLFGSVSTNVAQRAECPVLLVPSGVKYSDIRRILYASDFNSVSESTLEKLIGTADVFKADVHFVHVTEEKDTGKYRELENKIFKILFKGGDPTFSFTMSKVEGSSVEDGLNDYAVQHQVDMFVLVSPHRSFWDGLFHKSVTKAMALNTKLPILVFH